MPPFSKTIDEEGVLFDNFLLVRDGRCASRTAAQLAVGRWPARNPDQTIADLRAQIAANEKGVQELRPWWRSSAATPWRLHAACAGQRRGSRCAASSPR
jgi:N-methylhydantoinase B/oxoprolinase/acetone carboxylase alpha subunit